MDWPTSRQSLYLQKRVQGLVHCPMSLALVFQHTFSLSLQSSSMRTLTTYIPLRKLFTAMTRLLLGVEYCYKTSWLPCVAVLLSLAGAVVPGWFAVCWWRGKMSAPMNENSTGRSSSAGNPEVIRRHELTVERICT